MNRPAISIDCQIWLNRQQQSYLGDRRVELLEQIAATGSISQAARKIGMSYKSAWDAVDAMNNLSDQPLVTRSVGGTNGGGTEITKFGRSLIATYRYLQDEYENLLQRVSASFGNFDDLQQLMRVLAMKTSARNQLRGKVKSIKKGAVNGDVILDLGDGLEIFANITNESIDELQLAYGKDAIAIIKSSFVILSPDKNVRISARNRLVGTVVKTIAGAVNSEVKVELPGGRILTAVITNESMQEFGFVPGSECCALVKASHVIIAVND
ncbi:MAG: TOBE domain-containing protein [Spongiibacteraceae bacterium]